VKNALKDASGTLRNITGIELVSQTAKVDQSKGDSIIEYRSVIKIAFAYETE
jgi:flavin-binding protein dodecin